MLTNKLTGAGGGAADKTYVEDVFSTYLYTGTGASSQTITNGIDLAGKGGMVWAKPRNYAVDHDVWDTTRGVNQTLHTSLTDAQQNLSASLTSFTSTGFTIGLGGNNGVSGVNSAFWTFRKAPKFFDVVTWTGNGADKNIQHNLGTTPGMIFVKCTSQSGDPYPWAVWHRSSGTGSGQALRLNSTSAAIDSPNWFYPTSVSPSSTSFWVGGNAAVNSNGQTYVAYLFAHDTTTDGMIQCGSYTGNGSTSGPVVTLGWEPQYLLIKKMDSAPTGAWTILDTMRGMPVGSNGRDLYANFSDGEYNSIAVSPTSTGFQLATTISEVNYNGGTYIYMAIRRPMKVPTDGTKVYNGVLVNSSASEQTVDATFPSDLVIKDYRNLANGAMWFDRLRGYGASSSPRLMSSSTGAEVNSGDIYAGSQTTIKEAAIGTGYTSVDWFFKRASGFFDVVCYTGDGVNNRIVSHNLGTAFELAFIKKRSGAENWAAWCNDYSGLSLNSTAAASSGWTLNSKDTGVDVTNIVGASSSPNGCNTSGATYVAYLFASCPGVSKVGSYTGTGTTNNIDCGFTNGARFVLIKRTDAAGGWYVVDTARGIVDGIDPYLTLNTTAAEGTSLDFIDPYAPGFALVNGSSGFNAVGGSYIYLAIA